MSQLWAAQSNCFSVTGWAETRSGSIIARYISHSSHSPCLPLASFQRPPPLFSRETQLWPVHYLLLLCCTKQHGFALCMSESLSVLCWLLSATVSICLNIKEEEKCANKKPSHLLERHHSILKTLAQIKWTPRVWKYIDCNFHWTIGNFADLFLFCSIIFDVPVYVSPHCNHIHVHIVCLLPPPPFIYIYFWCI